MSSDCFQALLHAGILLKYKYSVTVGGASVLDNVVQVCCCFGDTVHGVTKIFQRLLKYYTIMI